MLEENVSGTWTERDYGTFSRSFDIENGPGTGCITSFTANPTTVTSGNASTLSWTTTGASVTSVTIDNGVGSKPASGSTNVSPTSTTTYTLSAFTTANGSPPTKQVTVTVGQPAPTATFSAAPTSITSGQSSTLTWTTTNATTVSIDNGVGSKPTSGSVGVSPTTTTTYTLTATGPGGTATQTATVTVTAPAPTISFSASPNAIASGDSSTLIWTTSNATTVTIDNGIGSQALSGSTIVHPTQTTTYTLTAIGPGGTMTSQATVTITQLPTIRFFASAPTIVSGASSTLNWIVFDSLQVTIDQGIGLVTGNGTLQVSPRQTTTYTLTALNAVGSTTASVTVTVTAAVPSRHRAVKH